MWRVVKVAPEFSFKRTASQKGGGSMWIPRHSWTTALLRPVEEILKKRHIQVVDEPVVTEALRELSEF